MTTQKQTDFWLNLADVLVLWSLAVAQPVYSVLSSQPEFFIARGAGFWAIMGFVLTLSLVLPLFLFGLEMIVSFGRVSRVPHFAIVSVLTGLLLFGSLKKTFQAGSLPYFLAALLIGAALSALYLHYRRRALALVVLSPAVLVLPLIFLFSPPIRTLLQSDDAVADFPQVSAETPIVLVVFDEFPVVSLMKEDRGIDVGRYPNFSALARQSTWYRNASAVAESTAHALPAILDGLYPNPDRMQSPNAAGHPNSLFTLLGGSYRFNVIENTTRVCPDTLRTKVPVRGEDLSSWIWDVSVVYLYTALPKEWTRRLPDVSHSWKSWGADKLLPLSDTDDPKMVFEEFVKRIESSDSTLNFVHFRLPHFPWSYLQNGRRYAKPEMAIRGTAGTDDLGEDPSRWVSDSWAVTQGHQRHLLQVGMADWLLGRLTNRLKEIGIYDEALILVTADHGASFRLGDSRRVVTPSNYADIIGVPLFIKKPHQTAGSIDDRNVEAVDLLPTIADILDIQLPWKVDGMSTENQSAKPRTNKTVVGDRGIRHEFDANLAVEGATLQRQLELFGSGDWRGVYRVGLPPQIAEKQVSAIPVSSAPAVEYEIAEEALYRDFNPAADVTITLVSGELKRPRATPFAPLRLVVSVNDRIVALTESYLNGDKESFAAVTADSDFVRGPNLVELFALSGPSEALRLQRLQKRAEPPYQLGNQLTFGQNGSGVRYLSRGWSFPEKNVRWNDGQEAELVFSMAKPEGLVILQAEVAGFLRPGKVDHQQVRVLINRQAVGEWSVRNSDFRTYSLLVPADVFKDSDRVIVRFETPNAVAPHAIGAAQDVRRLAVAFRSLALSDGSALGLYKWGDIIEFGSRGTSAAYRQGGWSNPEEGINWNDGTSADLLLPLQPPKGPVVLELFAKPFLVSGKVDRQRLVIRINGQTVGEKTLTQPGFQQVNVEIPADRFGASANTLLTLETPDAVPPKQIGASGDERRLAIAVRRLRLSIK